MTRIAIIDDDLSSRKQTLSAIQGMGSFEVAADLSVADWLSGDESPSADMVLIDPYPIGIPALEALRRMKASEPRLRCIVLTAETSERELFAALGSGADGYLLKDIEDDDLCAFLIKASNGVIVLQEHSTEILRNALAGRLAKSSPPDHELTVREQEILNCLERGFNNKTIARNLNISDSTVKVHIKNLLRKLNLTSRLEAAVWSQKRRPECEFSAHCPFGPDGRRRLSESKRGVTSNESPRSCMKVTAP